jgi:Tfp pilus assembly protein PilP
MRFIKTLVLGGLLFSAGLSLCVAQEVLQDAKKNEETLVSYNPGGRRDPFKDLFGGKETKDKKLAGGLSDLSVDDITIIGIVKTKDKTIAIISFTDGFPVTIREGDRFADGYILSIRDTQVILRKTRDKGVPLFKPKDIVKEIIP